MDIKLAPICANTIVVGAGLAGLAAASALAKQGQKVILVESKEKIGGRATSFVDTKSGDLIDNCQHVSMKCCTNLQYFCEEAKISHYIKDEPNLFFRTLDGQTSLFKGTKLPAPLHLANSFLRAHFLSLGEKLQLGLGMLLLRLTKETEDTPFLNWLENHFQPKRCIDRFWTPVLVSALNTPMEKIGLHYARKVFVDAFWKNSRAYELGLPTVPLGKLYGEEVLAWLKELGVEILFGKGVKSIRENPEVGFKVELEQGKVMNATNLVLAVPFQRVKDLLPTSLFQNPAIEKLDRLQTSPITSVHLWFDKPITDLPHIVLLDSMGQWLFSRGKNQQGEFYYQVVISSSGTLLQNGNEAALKIVLEELQSFCKDFSKARLIRGRVISEKQATFESSYGVDEFRPEQSTGVKGLYLAGDYTQTQWPATMEGAVRSGYLAAEKILKMSGKKVRCLQRDMN